MRVFSVLKQRDLALVWIAKLLSAIGDSLYEIAIVWISVELLGAKAGFVLAAGAISNLIFGIVGGVYADRFHRKKLMIATDILSAAAVFSLPVAQLLGGISLIHLILVSAMVGAFTAFFTPTLQASLPMLAPRTQTLNALNGLMDVTNRLASIIGPGLAGLLLALMPISQFFSIDALSFLLSALCLGLLARHYNWKEDMQSLSSPWQSFKHDLAAAWRQLQKKPHVLFSISINILSNLLWSSILIVGLALYLERDLQTTAGAYGLVIAAYGVSNVISNLVVGNLDIKQRTRYVFLGNLIFSSGLFLLAFASNLPVLIIFAAIAAVGGPITDLPLLLMIQQEFPSNMTGKIYSFRMTLASTGFSLGLLIAAPLFSLVPLSLAMASLSAITALTCLAGLIYFWNVPPTKSLVITHV